MNFKKYIISIKNYPINGIIFRDISALMENGKIYKKAIKIMTNFAIKKKADMVVGPEARGFIFGCPVAFELGIGFVPVRKKGKLPRKYIEKKYKSEYGYNILTLHSNSIKKNQRVLICDDLLATGGTIRATISLVEKLGGIVVGCIFLIELLKLKGKKNISKYDILSLIKY